jgi:4-amino-4-deoxy-L-arabinose transferase-like glycosyltransferase
MTRRHACVVGLLVAAAAGVALSLLPEPVVGATFRVIDPDRTVRPLNPQWVWTAGYAIAGIATATLLAFLALPLPRLGQRLTVPRISWDMARVRDAVAGSGSMSDPTVRGLLLATLAGAILRVGLAMRQTIEVDEAITFVMFGSRTVLDILSDYRIPNNHVLHTLLASLSYHVFGESTLAFRMPAVVAGVLCVPATFVLARRLFDARTALLAAVLVAVCQPLIDYGFVARGYGLVTLLFLVSMIALTRVAKDMKVGRWAVFVVISALSWYAVPVAVYGTLAGGAWLVLSAQRQRLSVVRQLAIAFLCIGVLAAVLYAPVLARSGIGSLLNNVNTTPLEARQLIVGWSRLVAAAATWWVTPYPVVIGAFTVTSLASIAIAPPDVRRRALVLIAAAIAGLIPLLLVQRVVPPLRSLVYLTPIVAICVACGCRVLLARLRQVVAIRGPAVAAVLTIAAMAWGLGAAANAQQHEDASPRALATVIRRFEPLLGAETVLVSHQFSGLVYPGRYRLLLEGSSPRGYHDYIAARSPAQLDPYRLLLVAAPRCQPASVVLGVPPDVFAGSFGSGVVVHESEGLCVLRVARLSTSPTRPSPYPDDPWGFSGLW